MTQHMTRRSSRLVLALGLTAAVAAQTVQGDLTGNVRDATGSAIPGAKITIVNETTGAVRTLESGNDGEYRAVGFFVGTYRVEAEKTGFKKTAVPGVKVEAVALRRVDLVLSIGDVAETVEVSDAVPVVQTEGSTINTTMPRVLYEKPIGDFTRSGWALNPAMWATGSSGGYLGVFLWGGVNGSQTELQVEGGQQSMSYFLNPTSIQEVAIVGGAPPAEYARAVNVNSTFKSGTNQLHGEYLASLFTPALSAVHSPFFRGNRPRALPQWRHNLDVGGPVYIPKLYNGRNKTFFYFNLSKPRGFVIAGEAPQSVPTQAMFQGDYSRFPVKPRDPLTGAPFEGDRIPASRISAVARTIAQDLYSTSRYVGDPNAFTGNAVSDIFRKGSETRILFKFDQNVGTRDVFTVSFQRQYRTDFLNPNVNFVDLPVGYGSFAGRSRFDNIPQTRLSIGNTHTFTPRLISQLRLAAFRDISKTSVRDSLDSGPVLGRDVLSKWGIQGIAATGLSGAPSVVIQNWAFSRFTTGAGSWDTRYQFNENITYVAGSHTLKTGFSGIKSLLDTEFNPGFGSFSFDGRFTGEPFADFLLGTPGNFSRALARPAVARRIWEFGAFAQDDWRLSQKLTLSFGMRWDHFTVPYDKNRLYYNFDLASGRIVVPDQFALDNISSVFNTSLIPVVLASAQGYPSKLRESSSRYLPRFGFAYRPTASGSFIIRGGYGVYNAALRFAGLQFAGPFTASEGFVNQLSGGRPLYSWPNAFPATAGRSPTAATGDSVSRNFRPEYTQTYNLTVEKALWANWGVRVSYNGNQSHQLPVAFDANTPRISTERFAQSRRPYPAFQGITRIENAGNDHYNALQMVLHHPFRNGLYIEVGYTEQRAWTDVGVGGPTGFQRESGPQAGVVLDYAYDRARDKGRSGVWPDHDFLINWAYDLPLGRGKKFLATTDSPAKWLLARVVGGWSTTGTFNWHSGYFFTPRYTGFDPANINQFGGRADVVPGCQVYTGAPKGDSTEYFNRSCFKVPAPGTLGNAKVNSLVSPGQWILTVSPFKEFYLPRWEGAKLRVGANISNILNHAVYGPPSGLITTPVGARLTNYPFTRRGTEGQGQRNMIVMASLSF